MSRMQCLPSTIRRLIVAALAPVPLFACGGAVSGTADSTGKPASPDSDGESPSESSEAGPPNTSPPPVPPPAPSYEAGCAPVSLATPGWFDASPSGDLAWVLYPCGGVPPLVPGSGVQDCTQRCLSSYFNGCNSVNSPDGGAVDLDSGSPAVVSCKYWDAGLMSRTGRRPAGFVEERHGGTPSVGEVLARAAHLESAAVRAFLDLAEQFARHGAPDRLVRRLRKAAGDEMRHARDVGALARAYGGEPPPVRVNAPGDRSLLALAVENAREGCVGETWGAACALAQAALAADMDVRATMHGIARDELRHAALSWDLAAWLARRLTADERARVAEERDRAIDELSAELETPVDDECRRLLGLATRRQAKGML